MATRLLRADPSASLDRYKDGQVYLYRLCLAGRTVDEAQGRINEGQGTVQDGPSRYRLAELITQTMYLTADAAIREGSGPVLRRVSTSATHLKLGKKKP